MCIFCPIHIKSQFLILSDCQMNKPLWTTLHLNGIINLEDVLNISKVRHLYRHIKNQLNLFFHLPGTNNDILCLISQQFERQIYQYFENADINIANITILTSDVKSQLRNFSDSFSSTNFSSITQQVYFTVHFQI